MMEPKSKCLTLTLVLHKI